MGERMNIRGRLKGINLEELMHINPEALQEDVREVFANRLAVIRLIHQGRTGNFIYRQCGISNSEQTRLAIRFLQRDPEGRYFGDRALIPQVRTTEYRRSAPIQPMRSQQQGGLSGVLKLTLERYPTVATEISNFILRFHSDFSGQKFDRKFIAAKFRSILKGAGVTEDEWPFNHKGLGQRTIEEYIDEILCSDFMCAASTLGEFGVTHAQIGSGEQGLISPSLPFDVVQLDAYKVDQMCIVKAEPLPGIHTSRVIDRFWLLAAVDSVSTGVLAARFVFSSEVRAQDVEDVLIDAFLGNWKPRDEAELQNLSYVPGSGMIGYVLPETRGALWGALFLDNAMAHHADKIKIKLKELIGFSVSYGQLKRPERRSIIENTFKQIAEQVMHRSPSTTGSGPGFGRAADAEENAEKYEVFVDEAECLLDVWLANLNVTPRSGSTFSMSPVELIRAHMNNYKMPIYLPVARVESLNKTKLSLDVEYCVVRGSAESGVAPHITIDKARYTNNVLSRSLDLVGQRLLVKISPKDLRQVEAVLPNGQSLGCLNVLGYWSKTAHSRITRKLINRALKDRTLEITRKDDIVMSFVDGLLRKRNKRSLLEWQRMERELSLSGQISSEGDPESIERTAFQLTESGATEVELLDDLFYQSAGGVADE
ncbi:MAG: hypothetical protein U0989_19395 [Azonexus sp.]|nr:hypothetical protein [Azonexus sp.]